MPRKGVRKDSVTFRINPDARRWITVQAREREITDGAMIRRMLSYASAHMPSGYRPAGETLEKRRPGT